MEMTAKDATRLLRAAKDLGVRYIRIDRMEAEFFGSETKASPEKPKELHPATPHEQPEIPDATELLSEEEILLMSSPYFDEMQAQKLAAQEEA